MRRCASLMNNFFFQAEDGIRDKLVTGVQTCALPIFVITPLTAEVAADPQMVEALAARTMVGRNGRPDDFAGAAVFLASPAAGYVTGQAIFVDGGFSAR